MKPEISTDEVLTTLDQVTAEWLTAVLFKSGALTVGSVIGCEVNRSRGNWSTGGSLHLEYAEGSKGVMPKRLYLKMVDADLDDEFFGASIVTYYTRDYLDVEDAPIIRCYSAAFSEQQLRYHLLLDDLSETYIEASQKAPTLDYGLALVEGLALMHARWWGAEGLAAAGAPMHSAEHIQRFVDIAEPGVGHILGRFEDELEPGWPDLLGELFAKHPQAIIERTWDENGFTLIHGDVGDTNVLVPRDGDRPIYIIDRQPFDWSLTTWLGVYDLAYAIVLDWEVETRRRLEVPVLGRYHEWLIRNGVRGYSWERLYDDYRLSANMGVYIATEYCRGGLNERRIPVWLPYLQRSLTACNDLNCRELW